MKYLILFLAVMSLSSIAKDKSSNKKVDVKIQTTEWMAKISSDPEMREEMIKMILDDTKGNKEEMTKFARTMLNNAELNSIIADMMQINTSSDIVSIHPFIMNIDSTESMKTQDYKLSSRK
jgi:hypothetical protein